jgi:hypothetical protein
MKVEKSAVTKVLITDIMGDPHRLDPITVFLEDIESRKGRITIRCYNKAWTAYWGGMGDQTIDQFFCSCDEHYIAKNLSNIDDSITDSEAIADGARRQIIKMRRGESMKSHLPHGRSFRFGRNDISAEEARRLWECIEYADFGNDGWGESALMQQIFGDEWWYRLPSKPNPEYQYLCRIIKAVQEALSMDLQPAPA